MSFFTVVYGSGGLAMHSSDSVSRQSTHPQFILLNLKQKLIRSSKNKIIQIFFENFRYNKLIRRLHYLIEVMLTKIKHIKELYFFLI